MAKIRECYPFYVPGNPANFRAVLSIFEAVVQKGWDPAEAVRVFVNETGVDPLVVERNWKALVSHYQKLNI